MRMDWSRPAPPGPVRKPAARIKFATRSAGRVVVRRHRNSTARPGFSCRAGHGQRRGPTACPNDALTSWAPAGSSPGQDSGPRNLPAQPMTLPVTRPSPSDPNRGFDGSTNQPWPGQLLPRYWAIELLEVVDADGRPQAPAKPPASTRLIDASPLSRACSQVQAERDLPGGLGRPGPAQEESPDRRPRSPQASPAADVAGADDWQPCLSRDGHLGSPFTWVRGFREVRAAAQVGWWALGRWAARGARGCR